jgi:hypothetical protein
MKRLLSVLLTSGLCCLGIVVLGITPASAGGGKVCLCHVPPGNPANAHTICVGAPAVRAHLGHGDSLGECAVACGGSAGDTCTTGQFCKRDVGLCSQDDQGVCVKVPTTCTGTSSPVCGCNGTTYDNACLADAAGVSVQHPGACATETACGGTAGLGCDTDHFCKKDVGACAADAEGVCTPLTLTCPSTLLQVCGCDETTYSNSCFADAAGVAIQHEGPCPEGGACGGIDGAACKQGQFCKPPVGECAANAPGDCAVIPAACSRFDEPVCGCDGTTYGNPCLADAASVGIDHPGACGPDLHACGGAEGVTCATGEFCNRPEGACAADAQGLCKNTPGNCPAILDPVCGCDGMSYSSPCVADGAGVTVANDGLCVPPRACGGETGGTCRSEEFCKGATGACAAGSAGTCAAKPTDCPVIKIPVCGCDGQTYDNSCVADAFGVTVDHTGACTP